MNVSIVSLLLHIAFILLLVVVCLYLYFKYCYLYWKNRGVPFIKPFFIFGNIYDVVKHKKHFGVAIAELYDEMKAKGESCVGVYLSTKPVLVPISLDLIKNIMTTDFQYFTARGLFVNEETDPLSAHLFALSGMKWMNLRNKITPAFTLGKIRKMFQIFVDCSSQLNDYMAEVISKGEPIDMKHAAAQFSIDVIGHTAFGIKCNTFKNPNSPFVENADKIFHTDIRGCIKMILGFFYPDIVKIFKIRMFSKEIENFYMSIIHETIQYRLENNIVENDFLQQMMQLLNNGLHENSEHDTKLRGKDKSITLTFNEVVAQCFFFFIAGYDTSSTTIAYTLYELALNQDIQDRVREEIINVLKKNGGEITVDSVAELQYMDLVIQETLRMHSPALVHQRICTKDYQIPGTNIVIEKGTSVCIPIMGIHYDPEYYTEPEKFNPDRFTEGNKAARPDFTYTPFGVGPRACIGIKFAMFGIKVALCALFMNYRFKFNPKTKQPLTIYPYTVINIPDGGIWLDVERCKS